MNEHRGQAGRGVGSGEEHDGQVLDSVDNRAAEALNCRDSGLRRGTNLEAGVEVRQARSRAVVNARKAGLAEILRESLEADERNIASR